MNYSEEFKQKVLSLKKINKEVANYLLSPNNVPSDLLGTILLQYEGVSAKDIIYAIENNDFIKIYEEAKEKLFADELFDEWKRDYYPQYEKSFYGSIDKSTKKEGRKTR